MSDPIPGAEPIEADGAVADEPTDLTDAELSTAEAAQAGAPEAADDSMISLRDVVKVYTLRDGTEVRALDGLTLTVPAGSIHGIVGTSGAGKSTLIRCLTALSSSQLREARRRIGMVFQHANLLDSRTTAQNIAYPLALAGVAKGERHETVAEMLDLVGLADRGGSYPSQLSGGQKQRVGIARALADQPAVLLCDEPTSALDPETTRSILDLIKDVRDRLGVTVVIITHEMSVVRQVCDSVSLLEAGRIVESGPIEDVASDVDSRLSHELVPVPAIPEGSLAEGDAVIDVALTAHPGQPAAAHVLALASEHGADVAGGVFETLGQAQVGRLSLTIPADKAPGVVDALAAAGATAEVRS